MDIDIYSQAHVHIYRNCRTTVALTQIRLFDTSHFANMAAVLKTKKFVNFLSKSIDSY